MGVWIETADTLRCCQILGVTPCMGVWIETESGLYYYDATVSHPVWVCGLKQFGQYDNITN